MKQLSLTEYLNSPCRLSSLPYWKAKNTAIPENLKIVHDTDFNPNDFREYYDEPYFRLCHNLKDIPKLYVDGVEIIEETFDAAEKFSKLINACYEDLSVTKEQMEGYSNTPVYRPELWILLKNKTEKDYVGGGIADFDEETGELILEWIQVLPSYRGRGYGSMIVCQLLSKMQCKAKFATVSGKINSKSNPESLYRKCGFTGNDVWHVLTKK